MENPKSSARIRHVYYRTWKYDSVGRLTGANETTPDTESVQYNALGNLTSTTSRVWNDDETTSSYTVTNNRNSGWTYDADGRVVSDGVSPTNNFDAAGNIVNQGGSTTTSYFDPEGKKLELYIPVGGPYPYWGKEFYFYSTVLGGKMVGKFKAHSCCGYTQGIQWEKERMLYKDGQLFATYQSHIESGYSPSNNDYVRWRHEEPAGSYDTTVGSHPYAGSIPAEQGEKDPRGIDVGSNDPAAMAYADWLANNQESYNFGASLDSNYQCVVDGITELGGSCEIWKIKVDQYLHEHNMGSLASGYWTWEDLDIEHQDPKDGTIHVYTDIRPVWNPAVVDTSKDAQKKLTQLIDFLKAKKFSDDCQKNVFDKLRKIGFDLDKFTAYLEKGADFYDGTKSKDKLVDVLDPTQINGTPPDGFTIQQLFKKQKNLDAQTSGTLSAKKLTVYWGNPEGGVDESIIWHEGLHGFGAFLNNGRLGFYDDLPLMNLLGVGDNDPNKSELIDQYIKKHCF